MVRVISFSTDQNIIILENSISFSRITEKAVGKNFLFTETEEQQARVEIKQHVCVTKCEVCVKYREKRSHIGYFTLGITS